MVREFVPYECVLTSTGMKPLYSAALLAYEFTERDAANVLAHASSSHWMQDGAGHCQSQPYIPLTHGERIDYHISLDTGSADRVWPNLAAGWPGFKVCAPDSAIFRRLFPLDIVNALSAGGDVSRGLLCQHIVIIGGTNAIGGDFVQTPLNEMNGSGVLANAVRGLQLTHGGMRPIPIILQVLLLMLASLAMSASALATEHGRHRYRWPGRSPHKDKIGLRLGIILLNPVILNGINALAAHGVGIVLLMISLNFGLWGFLSAPVFAAAITETVQEFADG